MFFKDVASFVGSLSLFDTQQQNTESTSLLRAESTGKNGKVAIIIYHEKDMWSLNVVQRFVSVLREQSGYQKSPEVDLLCAQESQQNLHALLRKIKKEQETFGQSYMAVITVGSWVSYHTRMLLSRWQMSLPQLFCCLADPVKLGLVESLDMPGSAVTGVIGKRPDYEFCIDTLKALMPGISTVLVPYNMSNYDDDALIGQTTQQCEEVCCSFGSRGIAVKTAQITRDNFSQVTGGVDVVCTIAHASVMAHMHELITLCNEKKIPLCTSELASVYQGASFGFGDSGATYGAYLASLVGDLIANNGTLSLVPVLEVPGVNGVRFNREAMVAQGVPLSKTSLYLLSMSSIFQ